MNRMISLLFANSWYFGVILVRLLDKERLLKRGFLFNFNSVEGTFFR